MDLVTRVLTQTIVSKIFILVGATFLAVSTVQLLLLNCPPRTRLLYQSNHHIFIGMLCSWQLNGSRAASSRRDLRVTLATLNLHKLVQTLACQRGPANRLMRHEH